MEDIIDFYNGYAVGWVEGQNHSDLNQYSAAPQPT
jgi:hypothetical protein